jgi:hypothetical protein
MTYFDECGRTGLRSAVIDPMALPLPAPATTTSNRSKCAATSVVIWSRLSRALTSARQPRATLSPPRRVRQFADRAAVEVKERDTRTSGDCDGPVCDVVCHRMSPGGRVAAVLRALRIMHGAAVSVAPIGLSPPLARSRVEGSVRPPSNRVCRQADRPNASLRH